MQKYHAKVACKNKCYNWAICLKLAIKTPELSWECNSDT